MAIFRLIASGHFGPDEIEAMTKAYEATLAELSLADRNDPLTEIIAKAVLNVTATGERTPQIKTVHWRPWESERPPPLEIASQLAASFNFLRLRRCQSQTTPSHLIHLSALAREAKP